MVLPRLATASISIAALAMPVHAAPGGLCVRPVPVVRTTDASPGASRGPSKFRHVAGGRSSVAFDVERTPAGTLGQYHVRSVFWRLAPGYRLTGPFRPDLDIHPRTRDAPNAAPRTLIVGSGYSRSDGTRRPETGQRWLRALYQIDDGQPPVPVAPRLQQQVAVPDPVFWSDVLRGHVVSGLDQRTLLVRGDSAVQLVAAGTGTCRTCPLGG